LIEIKNPAKPISSAGIFDGRVEVGTHHEFLTRILDYEESASLSTSDFKAVRQFDIEVGDFVYQYPEAKKDAL